MENLFKYLGIGAVSILMAPFLIIYFVIIFIATILNHIYNECVSVVRFFMGKSSDIKDKETIKYESTKGSYLSQGRISDTDVPYYDFNDYSDEDINEEETND